jgi:hypothetical protein
MKQILILITLLSSLISNEYRTVQRATYEQMKNEPRVALVIGNQAYKEFPLKQTISDANSIKNFLESVGFKVIYAENVKTKGEVRRLINRFISSIDDKGVGLFYFAGHGASAYNKNYLIPTNNNGISDEADIDEVGLSVNYLLRKLESRRNRLNIVILDACRNSIGRGLGQPLLEDSASGIYIAYATAMGSRARDNGVFTSSFIKNASIAGLKIEDVFKRVRIEVKQKTEGKQIPFTSSGLDGDFFFILPKGGLGTPNSIIYKEAKQDNTLLWWLLLGLIVALFYLLFLLLKPKGQKSKIGRIITKPKGFIEMGGLIYQNQPFTKQYSWQEAKEYAKNLRLGGFDD